MLVEPTNEGNAFGAIAVAGEEKVEPEEDDGKDLGSLEFG